METVLGYVRQSGFTLELLLACSLFMLYLNKKPHFGLRFAACAVFNLAIAILFQFQNAGLFLTIFKFFLRYLSVLVLILFCCDIPHMDALFCSVCSYAVQHLTSSLCFLLSALLHNQEIGLYWYHPYQLCIMAVVYLISWHLVAKQLPENGTYQMGASQAVFSAAMVLSFTLVLNTFAGTQYQQETSGPVFMLYVACVLYDILCCIFVMAVQVSRRKEEAILREKKVQELLWQQQKGQYEMTRETIDIINHKCHDLKHQVAALEQCNRSSEDRQAYLNEIQRSLDIYDCSIQTGNEVLDTVLTEKLLICKQNQIELTCMAEGHLLGFMTSVDLYTIFGNALDNAIESVSQVSIPEKRIISINVFSAKALLIIQIENYYEHELYIQDGLPVSTKIKNGYHGFGLSSIRYTAERYHGFLTISGEDHLFLLCVTIPLKESE